MTFDPAEDTLLTQLLAFQHAAIDIFELRKATSKVSWAKGFPELPEAFWNCEAFMWTRKVSEKSRVIYDELRTLEGCRNLDLGCGSNSYIKSAVGIDFSEKMLQFNDTALEKVKGGLGVAWPFPNSSFDLVMAVFVLNYVDDLNFVFSEVQRVLLGEGKFVVILSATGVSELHQQHEQQKHSFESWKQLFEGAFDSVEVNEKEGLWFFVCSVGRS